MIWLLIPFLCLLLSGFIPIRAGGSFYNQTPRLWLGVGSMQWFIYPRKVRHKKRGKKLGKPNWQDTITIPKGTLLELVQALLPVTIEGAQETRKRLTTERLYLTLIVGCHDPADAAIYFGQANALLGTIWQPLTEILHIKDGHAHVELDFQKEQMELNGEVVLSMTIYQILGLWLWFIRRMLPILKQVQRTRKVAKYNGKATSTQ